MFKKAFVIYGCQIYKAILPLVFTPLILDILGTERYGVIAFFYMLVGVLGLLDAGISGTFLKLVSTNKLSLLKYKKVTRLFIKVLSLFFLVATLLCSFFFLGYDFIISHWLSVSIDRVEIIHSMKIIGFILASLYIKSYLGSFINGMEKQECMSAWNACYSSFFYFLSYYALKKIDRTLFVFFDALLIFSLVDLFVVFCMVVFFYLKHIKSLKIAKTVIDLSNKETESELKFTKVLHFSLQLSGLSLVWVIATQVDKFVLSAFIPLSEYAKYQIAVQLCSVISLFSVPLTQIMLPRLSALYANDEFKEYSKIYSLAIFFFVVILSPVIPYFFVFGNDIISLWMKSNSLGPAINSYAKWLISAAFLSASMNFVFILLYTVGKLKKHFYAYAAYSLFTIPVSVFVAIKYGATGSSKFVFFHTLLFMFLWGGVNLKKMFDNLISSIVLLYLIVMATSLAIFTSLYYLYGVKGFWLVTPPLLNFLINIVILFSFKSFILKRLGNINLVVR